MEGVTQPSMAISCVVVGGPETIEIVTCVALLLCRLASLVSENSEILNRKQTNSWFTIVFFTIFAPNENKSNRHR